LTCPVACASFHHRDIVSPGLCVDPRHARKLISIDTGCSPCRCLKDGRKHTAGLVDQGLKRLKPCVRQRTDSAGVATGICSSGRRRNADEQTRYVTIQRPSRGCQPAARNLAQLGGQFCSLPHSRTRPLPRSMPAGHRTFKRRTTGLRPSFSQWAFAATGRRSRQPALRGRKACGGGPRCCVSRCMPSFQREPVPL